MTLVPLELPPGVWGQGTEYQAKGRWRTSSLVRWRNGAMQPVGGWSRYETGTFAGIARGGVSWTDNSNGRWLAWGTPSKAYVMSDLGVVTEITPGGLAAGNTDATKAGGYGQADYGEGTYGTPRPDVGTVTPATTWSWDTFGQIPIACSDTDGTIYEWDLNTANDLVAVSNAPTQCSGVLVTAERFVVALGESGDPRSIAWSDRELRTVWTPATTNQAGNWTLDTDGQIMFGAKGRGDTLIVTTTDAHRMSYIGYPYVYSFDRVGSGCGAVGRLAHASTDGRVFWLGSEGFYLYENGYVKRLPCSVWDTFKADVDDLQISKTTAFHNHEFAEVWWLYPDDATGEVSKYIAFNYEEGYWHLGSVPASFAVAKGTFSTPMGLHTDGKIYEHESGFSHGSYTPFCESGPIEISVGERWVHVTKLIPDELDLGSTKLTFKVRSYPTADTETHGPFTMTEPTSVRFSGRSLQMRVEPSAQSDWRFGVPRIEVVAGGRR